jgi:hypothetical protein
MRVPALLEPTRLPGDATKADSDLGKNTGHLDHISDVLKRYKHPFILVCYAALYWMGVGRSGPWFDMVIRNDQLKAVAADLIETGHWTLYDFGMETGMENGRPYALYEPHIFRHNERFLRLTNDDTHVLLKRVNQQGMEFKYLQLWSKDKYSINVAECPLIEVPDIYAWHSFLIKEAYHPEMNRTDGWWYGPRTLTKTNGTPLFSPRLPRGKSLTNANPVSIPRIPAHLDALVLIGHITKIHVQCYIPMLAGKSVS